MTDAFEVLFDAFRRNLAHQYRIDLITECDQSDVCRVTFITGTSMGQFY
jgi:hypothetical protein